MASHSKLSVSNINNVQLGAGEEAKGNLEQAAKYYESAIKVERADEFPFNRLMIIYRKQKLYKDELRVIKKGIKTFEDFYKRQTSKKGKGRKLSELSEAFMKTTGLKDKKGKLIYQPEPIGKWARRKEVVEKKMK
jgi:tetratricopeptide (TPR) repeat protein